MKRRIFSLVLALCLCMSLIPAVYAEDAADRPDEVNTADTPDTVNTVDAADGATPAPAADGTASDSDTTTTTTIPTPAEVYDILIGYKEKPGYTQGTSWTDANKTYTWKGGAIDGAATGTGCMAFAFELSDAAFGSLPARKVTSFNLSDVMVGDILRINNNTHSVIVLQVNSHGVVIAEGNLNSAVNWERTLDQDAVEASGNFLITRWPEGYDPGVDPDDPIDPSAEGTIGGTGLTWKVTNGGTLVISGTGAMTNFSESDQPWHGYASRILSVEIGNGVTSVGDNAFRAYTNLISATIPEGVTSIGENAFRSCGALTSITLPASITSVGAGAFYQCQKITTVTFKPGSATVAMGDNLFTQCYALSTVTLPQKADCIGGGTFQNCLMLTSVALPEDVTNIGVSAFASCSALKQISIPASVTTIGTAAFSATGVTDIYFGGNESQWNAVTKQGDTASFVAQDTVTVHFGETMPETPSTPSAPGSDPDPVPDPDPDPTPTPTPSTPSAPSTPSRPSAPSTPSTPTTSTSTTHNPDGTTTVTVTNNSTGTVTATTSNPDGSQTVVETKKDGTVTTQETDTDGNQTVTVVDPDGSSTVTLALKDGTTATIATNASGSVEAEVSLPGEIVSAAQESGKAVALPIPEVQVAQNTASAPVVTVNTGSSDPVKVEIPAAAPTSGTVAVIVHEDGTEEIVKSSVPTADGVAVSLPDGAAVKLVDNSKDFADVAPEHWAVEAIDFVSARELFAGTSEDAFSPEAPMTRAMLMVVLARFDGADTESGATWYEQGLAWAVANGISDGTGFNQSITREQLVTMLWRYAGSPAASGELSDFTDTAQISDYARQAMLWAVENGIVSGFGNGQLVPQGQATRAQVAQMLENFIVM